MRKGRIGGWERGTIVAVTWVAVTTGLHARYFETSVEEA